MIKVGAILAGGQGTRLGGVRKGDLRIGGKTMLARVRDALESHVDQMVLSLGRENLQSAPRALRTVLDVDDLPKGPLAGLRAIASSISKQSYSDTVLITVAADTPFLPNDFVPRLLEALGKAPAACAAWNGHNYPTNAAWRLAPLLSQLEMADENWGPSALLRQLDAPQVSWNGNTDPFANLNTLSDLISLQRRALAIGEKPRMRPL